MKRILSYRVGYDGAGNQVKTKDWAQNYVTDRAIRFRDASIDLDGEAFDLDEMDAAGLYNEEKDVVVIPKNSKLNFKEIYKDSGYSWAVYELPEYNNVELYVNFDYWKHNLSLRVKVAEPVQSDTAIVSADSNTTAFNTIATSIIELLMQLGFVELQDYSGAYAILDETENNIVCYDDNSGTFSVLEGGALNDKGTTFMEYINEKDGWEVFLEDHPSVRVVDYSTLEEALGW